MARMRETKRAFAEDGARKTHIGGQALIEGVMMRGKLNWAVGVREPDGSLYAEEHELSRTGARPAWMSLPLVRGCVVFVDSLVLGYKALEIAANHALAEEDAEGPQEASDARAAAEAPQDGEQTGEHPFFWKDDFGRPDPVLEALGAQTELAVVHEPAEDAGVEGPGAAPEPEIGKGEMTFALVAGIVLGVALFVLLPALASNLLVGDYERDPLAWNLVDGVMRVAIFVFYVWLIGRMKDIKRMFAYHGAEHKTIHCYEHGDDLTPENARRYPRLHVRCGTAFLIMVMLVAIVVYTLVPLDDAIAALGLAGPGAFALLIFVRIALMPVIAGVSYEITVRWAGTHPENPLVRIVLWPGMQMQRLTTNEPDDGMLECAIAAMKLVIAREEREGRA